MNSEPAAAYGGPGWQPRTTTTAEELGRLWAPCGISDEWSPLRSVLLHRPGPEWLEIPDPDEALMLAEVDPDAIVAQHRALEGLYRSLGVEVHLVDPAEPVDPNLMFCADLFVMTPEGAILARPAGRARAGEERWVARRLADMGVPVLTSIHGSATFEGADLMWVDDRTVLLGRGMRTNDGGVAQIVDLLRTMGVDVVVAQQPVGSMHFMSQLRIVDGDLALAAADRLSLVAVELLRSRGYQVLTVPPGPEISEAKAFNIVTVGPREIVMPDGCDRTREFYENAGITTHVVDVSAMVLAAGAIGCVTGVIHRGADLIPAAPTPAEPHDL